MRQLLRTALLASGLVVGLSCADPVSPDGDVALAASREMVYLKNTDDERPLYSIIMTEETASRIDIRLCVEDRCGLVRPGETRRVSAEEIDGKPGDVVQVWTWRGEYGPADQYGPGPATIRRVVLRSNFLP